MKSLLFGLSAFLIWATPGSPADPPRVNARQFVNEYHADNNAAIAKYARKPIQIDGVFEKTTLSGAETQFLHLNGESEKRTLPIDCMLKGEEAKTNYPFKKGDPVSIVGTWDGSLFLGSYISIFPCKVLTGGLTGGSAAAGLGPKPISVIPSCNYNCSGLAVRLKLDIGIKDDYAIEGKGDGQYRYDPKSGVVTWLSAERRRRARRAAPGKPDISPQDRRTCAHVNEAKSSSRRARGGWVR